jgi:hypothetical protein
MASDRPPEVRHPSDTQPIDGDELRRRLDEMRAEAAEAEDREERPTGTECPYCAAIPREPACTVCDGAGIVDIPKWRSWLAEPGPRALVRCPACRGEGRTIDAVEGRYATHLCMLCRGDKRVPGNFAEAWERTHASRDQEA